MSHEHHVTKQNYNKAFSIGIALNLAYIIVEFIFGLMASSMSLLADAGHNLSDVLGLLLAWGASYLARRPATSTKTYGMRKSTILAALINAVIVFITVGAIAIEAINRFIHMEHVAAGTIIIIAAIGFVINSVTAVLFMSGRKKDLNIKAAFLHMAADAGVSLGVAAGGIVMQLTGFYLLDPILSLLIIVIIVISTWGTLKESFNLSMDAVPNHIELDKVKDYLETLPGVNEVHDLHIWALSTTESVLTAHLVKPEGHDDDEFISQVCKELNDRFNIGHTTIQLEKSDKIKNCGVSTV